MTTYEQRIVAFKRQHGIGRRGPLVAPMKRSGYDAARVNRLTADWQPGTSTADSDIQFDSVSLRDRCRQMEKSDPYVSRFLKAMENNVLTDEVGFSLQMKATRAPDFITPDTVANQKIEFHWRNWCRPATCTDNGEDSFYDVCKLSLRSCLRDGGILIRHVIDPENPFGYALKLIEIDHLDVNYTTILPSGNFVVMGKEKNQRGRVIAYHLLSRHPGELIFGQARNSPQYRVRVDASEITHYYIKERVTQSVGVPLIAPSMLRLRHLNEYEISEMAAAREAANKGGYFTSERGDAYQGENETDPATGETTGTIANSEPGQNDQLPPGMTFVPYDPTHPTQQFGDFVKNSLRGASVGMGISYVTLTGDLSEANYSSMRSGKMEEQEGYKKFQCHMIEHLVIEVFNRWLPLAITSGALNLPISKLEIFNRPKFKGRRWPWVDPEKDVNAALKAIDGGLSTRTKEIDDAGGDIEDTFQELENEESLAAEHGLEFVTAQKPLFPPQPDATEPSAEDAKKTS